MSEGNGTRVPCNMVDEVVHNLDTDREPWSIGHNAWLVKPDEFSALDDPAP